MNDLVNIACLSCNKEFDEDDVKDLFLCSKCMEEKLNE